MTNSNNNIERIASIYDRIFAIQEESKKNQKAFERKMKRLNTPITELNKYYTVLIQYDWGKETEREFRTKAEAMKFFANEIKEAKEYDELEGISFAGLTINKINKEYGGYSSSAIATKHDIFDM